MRRLPSPAGRRLSEGDQTLEALFELFRDWQRHKLSLLGGLFGVLDSKWMSGSAGAGTTSREATAVHEEDPHDKGAETCNDRREGKWACAAPAPPLPQASLRLRCSMPGSCACCQLRKTEKTRR